MEFFIKNIKFHPAVLFFNMQNIELQLLKLVNFLVKNIMFQTTFLRGLHIVKKNKTYNHSFKSIRIKFNFSASICYNSKLQNKKL